MTEVIYEKPIQTTRSRERRGSRLRVFKWVFVVGALAAIYVFAPSPYLRWQYEFTSPGGTMNPYADRRYLRCDYIGTKGTFTVRPNNGVCEVFVWRRRATLQQRLTFNTECRPWAAIDQVRRMWRATNSTVRRWRA